MGEWRCVGNETIGTTHDSLFEQHFSLASGTLLDGLPDVIFTVSYPELIIGYCNRSALQFFEKVHATPDPRGRKGDKFTTAQSEPFWDEAVSTALVHGVCELRHQPPTGRHWHVRVARIDAEGRCVGLTITARDMTDMEQTRSNLVHREGMYRALFDSMGVGAVHHGRDGRILAVNRQAEIILGRDAATLMGLNSSSPDWDAIHEDGTPFAGEEHPGMVTLRTGQPQSDVYMGFRLPNGERRWIIINSQPVPASNGSHECHAVVTFKDLTEKRALREQLKDQVTRLDRALEDTLTAMADMIDVRDPYTAGHQRQVARLGDLIAREMGLPAEQCRLVRLAGLVHDIGKIGIPAEILVKPMRLTPLEFAMVREHVDLGYRILNSIEFAGPIAAIVRQHHERLDGSGYPLGLSGAAITLEARIVAVADVFDSIASHRPYRAAMGVEAAAAELQRYAGRWYDADVVAACVRVLNRGELVSAPANPRALPPPLVAAAEAAPVLQSTGRASRPPV
jgi:PAS domain S-box-containing protein/putative nucleotidyltransferase with HDIG domain